jgi:hypothetical protein
MLFAFMRAGHPKEEIYALTGWDKQEVINGIRRVQRNIKIMRRNPGVYLSKPSQWEAHYPLMKPDAFSVSILGIFPRNIHPDSITKLLNKFSVNSLEQLRQQYNVLVRFDHYNTDEPKEVVTFTPHAALGLALLRRTPIDYQDYIVSSEPIKGEKDKWKTRAIFEERGGEYRGYLDSINYDQERENLLSKWTMPSLGICVYKHLDSKKLHASLGPLFNPAHREPYIGIYQTYPLENSRNGESDHVVLSSS